MNFLKKYWKYVIGVLIYTALVSFVSISAYKSYLGHQIESAFSDAFNNFDDVSNNTSNSENISNNSLSTETKASYNVGETYKDNSVSIRFVSLNDNFTDYNQYADVKDNHRIIQAEFEFENIGKSDFLASSYDFNCYADGYACEDFWSVDDSSFSSNLSSGKKIKGTVYFQVPNDATNITLEYEINAWTSNKVIFNVK